MVEPSGGQVAEVEWADEPEDDQDDYLAKSPDAARMGKAVEHLVAASCILTSRGELNALTALVDDEGVDLVLQRRGGSATLAVQVKSRMSDTTAVQRGRFQALVRSQTFRPRPDLDVLFVTVDAAVGRLLTSWLVPSADLAAVAKADTRDRLKFVASLKPDSHDQWRRHRLEPDELPGRVLARLAELERGG